jgi:hypothetical protein
MVLWYDKAKL